MPREPAAPPTPRGMTLVELVVVITIIGILALMAIPRYQGTVVQANDAVLISDLRNLALAQEAYLAEHHAYAMPTSAGILNDKGEVLWKPSPGILVMAAGTASSATAWRATVGRAGTFQECRVLAGELEAAASGASAGPDPAGNVTCYRASTVVTVLGSSRGGSAAGAMVLPSKEPAKP